MEIRIKDLTKIFPGDAKKNIRDTIAVKDMDFVVPDGTLVGLLGPSGCGKSTTLYMISGLQVPTSGEVWFGDQEVTNLSPEKRGIGLVFQNYALYPHMTIYKNIEFPLTNLKVEVPLVTFFDFDYVYSYNMKKNDVLDGILKSLDSLMKKIGLNKKGFAITHSLEGEKLTLNISLKNQAKSTAKVFEGQIGRIIEVEQISRDEKQTSEALFDTTVRATVNFVSESELMNVTYKARLPKTFTFAQLDDTINAFKERAKEFGRPGEVVVSTTQTGHEIAGLVYGVKHIRLKELNEKLDSFPEYERPVLYVNQVMNKDMEKDIKKYFKGLKLNISDLKVYFERENSTSEEHSHVGHTRLYFKLNRCPTEVAKKSLEDLIAKYELTDVTTDIAQAVAHRSLTKEERQDIVYDTAKLVQVDEYLARKPNQLCQDRRLGDHHYHPGIPRFRGHPRPHRKHLHPGSGPPRPGRQGSPEDEYGFPNHRFPDGYHEPVPMPRHGEQVHFPVPVQAAAVPPPLHLPAAAAAPVRERRVVQFPDLGHHRRHRHGPVRRRPAAQARQAQGRGRPVDPGQQNLDSNLRPHNYEHDHQRRQTVRQRRRFRRSGHRAEARHSRVRQRAHFQGRRGKRLLQEHLRRRRAAPEHLLDVLLLLLLPPGPRGDRLCQ